MWREHSLPAEQKISFLNNLETVHEESIAYMDAMPHDIYTIAEADARYYRTPSHPSGRSDTGEGCGIDAAKCDGYTLAQILAAAIPEGAIGMWKAGALPDGFQECNGLSGAPDLRDYMPKGAGLGVTPGSSGGSNTASPTANAFDSPDHLLADNEIPKHQHSYLDWTNNTSLYQYNSSGGGYRGTTYRTVATTLTQPGAVSTRTAHKHTGSLFSWTGYLDDDSTHHDGQLDIRPLSRAVTFIMRSYS